MGFSQALSGVGAAAQQLDVVGNNIANSQTTGFKSSSVQFADVFANSQVGLGTRVSGVLQDFSNGSLETTGRDLDLAISGGGFFRFSQNGEVGYSRNGQLSMTADGYLANSQGALLTGYNVANFNSKTTPATVPTGGLPEVIHIPSEAMAAKATSESSANFDLDSSDEVKSVADFDSSDPATYNYSSSMSVFDSQGNAYNLKQYFLRTGANNWEVKSRADLGKNATFSNEVISGGSYPGGVDPVTNGNGVYTSTDGKYIATVTGATAGSSGTYSGGSVSYQAVLQDSKLTFDVDGQLGSVSYYNVTGSPISKPDYLGGTEVEFGFDGKTGAAPLKFSFDYSGTTQTAQDYAINDPRQNGYESGKLVGINVTDDGLIQGNYSNQETIGLGRVVLSNFRNPEGLKASGDNMWAETKDSGAAVVGMAGTGQFGTVQSETLEQSNVDLTQELVNLIIAQRNYQANTNSIRTQSEVMDQIAQLR